MGHWQPVCVLRFMQIEIVWEDVDDQRSGREINQVLVGIDRRIPRHISARACRVRLVCQPEVSKQRGSDRICVRFERGDDCLGDRPRQRRSHQPGRHRGIPADTQD